MLIIYNMYYIIGEIIYGDCDFLLLLQSNHDISIYNYINILLAYTNNHINVFTSGSSRLI